MGALPPKGPVRVIVFLQASFSHWIVASCLLVSYSGLAWYVLRTAYLLSGPSRSSWLFQEGVLVIFLAALGWGYVREYIAGFPSPIFAAVLGSVILAKAIVFVYQWTLQRYWDGPFQAGFMDGLIVSLAVANVLGRGRLSNFSYLDVDRAVGIFANPNVYGMMMAVGLILTLGRCGQDLSSAPPPSFLCLPLKPRLIMHMFIIGAFAAGLIESYSRSAWFGGLIGIMYMLFFSETLFRGITSELGIRFRRRLRFIKYRKDIRRGLTFQSFGFRGGGDLLIILIITLSVIATEVFIDRSDNRLLRRISSVTNPNDFSVANRLSVALSSNLMMADRPFLGFGWTSSAEIMEDFYKDPKLLTSASIYTNAVVITGCSAGIPAMLSLVVYGLVVVRFPRGCKLARCGMLEAMMIRHGIFGGASCVMMVCFLFNEGFYTFSGAFLWIMWHFTAIPSGEEGEERGSGASAYNFEKII